MKSGDRFPELVTTDDGKSVVPRLFHCGAADPVPVPVCVRNSLVVEVLPASLAAAPPVLPIKISPSVVIGFANPTAEIVICPVVGVKVTPLPPTRDFHSIPPPLCAMDKS